MTLKELLDNNWVKIPVVAVETLAIATGIKALVNLTSDYATNYTQKHPESKVMQLTAEELDGFKNGLEGLAYAGGLSPTEQNIRELEAHGWKIYRTRNDFKKSPSGRYSFLTRHDRFNEAWVRNEQNIQQILNDESNAIHSFIDSNSENDEIRSLKVSDDNYVVIAIYSGNNTIGWDVKGKTVYFAEKKYSKDIAQNFRKISPDSK